MYLPRCSMHGRDGTRPHACIRQAEDCLKQRVDGIEGATATQEPAGQSVRREARGKSRTVLQSFEENSGFCLTRRIVSINRFPAAAA
jgi:hypothetical protein